MGCEKMLDETKIAKYKNIVYRLNIINNKITDLNFSISSLRRKMDKYIMIDDEIVKEDLLKKINRNLNNTSYSIKNNIIPSLNNKIYN